ncbi:MAG: hypothetical protein IPI96_16170 [Saprospiraceae bacterium]|nr:hypothetical protein [Saprospiraceae bacterium]
MPEVSDISLITYLGDKRYPRGMRNNNPGNIRYNKNINWKGKISKENQQTEVLSIREILARCSSVDYYFKFLLFQTPIKNN